MNGGYKVALEHPYTQNDVALLKELTDYTNDPAVGGFWKLPMQMHKFVKNGHAEAHPELTNGSNKFYRATPYGISFTQTPTETSTVSEHAHPVHIAPSATPTSFVPSIAPTKTKGGFTIDNDVPMPDLSSVKTRGGRSEIYPFELLNIGQSFFVPATTKQPDMVKSLQSTLAKANTRFAPKLYAAVADSVNGVSGARVFRYHDLTAEQYQARLDRGARLSAGRKSAKEGLASAPVQG